MGVVSPSEADNDDSKHNIQLKKQIQNSSQADILFKSQDCCYIFLFKIPFYLVVSFIFLLHVCISIDDVCTS